MSTSCSQGNSQASDVCGVRLAQRDPTASQQLHLRCSAMRSALSAFGCVTCEQASRGSALTDISLPGDHPADYEVDRHRSPPCPLGDYTTRVPQHLDPEHLTAVCRPVASGPLQSKCSTVGCPVIGRHLNTILTFSGHSPRRGGQPVAGV